MTELDKALKDGEIVIWKGKPENYKILDKTNRPVFIKRCVICVVICVAVELLYLWLTRISNADLLVWLMVVIFVACAASPILFLLRSRKLKKGIYAATNYRLITFADQVVGVTYNRIKEYSFKMDPDGHTSLLCGKKGVSSKPGKWRELALFGNPDDNGTGPCEKFAFYAISKPDEIRKVLSEKIRSL